MSLFKGSDERQAAREQREREKAVEAERKRQARRAKTLRDLHEAGVLGEEDDASTLSDLELRTKLSEYLREKAQEQIKQMKQRNSVQSLGIMVKADGTVCDRTWGRRIGPLAGARAEVTDSFRHHRAGAALSGSVVTMGMGLGPAGALVGLSKKSIAIAVIVFPDGTVHQHRLDGAWAIRQAEVAAIAFNAMAQAAAGNSMPAAEQVPATSGAAGTPAFSAADEIKKLAELHAAGILTDEEFAAKKKQLLGL